MLHCLELSDRTFQQLHSSVALNLTESSAIGAKIEHSSRGRKNSITVNSIVSGAAFVATASRHKTGPSVTGSRLCGRPTFAATRKWNYACRGSPFGMKNTLVSWGDVCRWLGFRSIRIGLFSHIIFHQSTVKVILQTKIHEIVQKSNIKDDSCYPLT